jgi:hypothetical protein|tara:strand:+ start:8277 stop:10775 length:2499 start_codon:yes stop_codon:yes gene_type:complete
MAETEIKSPGLSQDTQDKLKVLGGTGLGIGALALFSKIRGVGPVVKAASKVVQKEAPQFSEPQIIKNDLAKIQKKEMVLDRKILGEERAQLEKLKGVVLDNPLTNGTGQTLPSGGSALFDFVALHPSKKNLPAGEWANLFSNNKALSGEMTEKFIKQAGGRSKFKANFKKEELDDLNIARYDNQGNLVDGFLKFAQDNNATVSKNTLLEMITNSPVNKIKRVRLETPQDIFDSIKRIDKLNETADSTYEEALVNIARKFKEADLGNSADPASSELGTVLARVLNPASGVGNLKNRNQQLAHKLLNLRKKTADHHNFFDSRDSTLDRDFTNNVLEVKSAINSLAPENRAIFTTDNGLQGLDNILENEKKVYIQFNDITKSVSRGRENKQLPQFGTQTGYRMYAPESYYEDNIYFPKNSIVSERTQMKKGWTPNHYDNLAGYAPETISGNIDILYWTRFGKRSTMDGKKTLAIDELQSPQQNTQKLVKALDGKPAERARISPVNSDFDGRLYKDQIRAALDEQISINEKAFRITPDDERKYRDLENVKKVFNDKVAKSTIEKLKRQPFKKGLKGRALEEAVEARTDLIKRFELDNVNPTPQQAIEKLYLQDDVAHFMPLKEADDWSNDALKRMLRNAADLDADYISINPTEYVHHLRGYIKGGSTAGNFKFYGTADGKSGFPGQTKVFDGTDGVMKEVPYDGKAMAKQKSIMVKEMEDLAKRYNTEVMQIDVAKSDPKKPYKILRYERNEDLYKDLGLDPKKYIQHEAAFATPEERALWAKVYGANTNQFVDMFEIDANLYYKSIAIKVPKNMKELPVKQYKAKGGLVVDIFKW